MKNITKNKGITLVALVVTIIILLILAGISISQLSGSGLFENVKLAEQKSKEAQEKENGILDDYENKIEKYIDSSRDTVTISQEEYEILKNANSYSTEEKVVGTWLDGKKLYQKTIDCGNGTDTKKQIAHNILNVDFIQIINADLFDSETGQCFPLTYYEFGDVFQNVRVNRTNIEIIGNNTWFIDYSSNCYVTLRYTKTTDSTSTIN